MDRRAAWRVLRRVAERLPAREGRVRWRRAGRVVTIELDHPQAANALTVSMLLQLADALEATLGAPSPPEVLVLRSARGGHFCAGAHLDEVERALLESEPAEALFVVAGSVLDRLAAGPAWSVAVLEGLALGGGAELAIACSARLGTPRAGLGFVHQRLGVVPALGGARHLVRRVGPGRARRILGTAHRYVGLEAVAMGLVDAVADDVASLLADWLDEGASGSRAVDTQVTAALRGEVDAEKRALLAVWGGPGHRAALARRSG